jgi:outer membrane protein assembly factor BamB
MTQNHPTFPAPYPGQPQDVPRRRPRRPITPARVVVRIIAAALAGAAVTLAVHGWGAVITESGGSCGGHHGGACPQGTFVSTGLGMLPIITGPATVATLFRKPRWLVLPVVLAVVGGVFAGQAAWGALHGPTLSVAWSAPRDDSTELKTMAAWVDGDALVRARIDQVVSYAATTGQVNWTYPLPGQSVLCSASTGTDAHLAALAYSTTDDGPCDHWQLTVPSGDDVGSGTTTDFVAIGAGVVTVGTERTLLGYDEKTGAPRWTRALPQECIDPAVRSDQGALAVLYDCADAGADDGSGDSYVIASLDPATGSTQWQVTRTAPAGSVSVSLVTAEPLVVDESQIGPRGTDNLLVYDDSGKPTSTIKASSVSTPDGPRKLDVSAYSFEAAPVRWVWQADGLLIATTQPSAGEQYLAAFRLSDGKQVWQTALPEMPVTAGISGHTLYLLTDDAPTMTLRSIPVTGGEFTDLGVVPGNFVGGQPELYPVAGDYLVVNQDGSTPYYPVEAIAANGANG